MRKPKIKAALNLLPVMNLVTILIPLLLMGAQLMNLAVVDTTLPAICNDCGVDPGPDKEKPLHLSLVITAEGLNLSGGSAVIDDGRIPCDSGICRGVDSYDFATLTERLAAIKDAHPNEETLILVPGERVPYEVIIGAMDAARQSGDRDLFPSVTISGGAAG